MDTARLHQLASVAVAGVVGAALFDLADDAVLSGVTGLVLGLAVLLYLRVFRQAPDAFQGGRWAGLFVGTITLAAILGVSPTLAVTGEVRLALGLLVIGTGAVGYLTSTLAAVEPGRS